MKNYIFLVFILLVIVSCSKFDDSDIWDELNNQKLRIEKLEMLCNQINTNVSSLQTIITAIQNNDYVTNVAPIMEGDKEIGYTITFAKNGSITIYHGKDGKNGMDGVDGTNGVDGNTPLIGIKQYEGIYYWTINGEWLLDDSSNKVKVEGKDGENGQDGINGTDGQNGKDGVTPTLRIDEGYWQISYDNGTIWTTLGQATSGNEVNNIITSVTQDGDNVYFNLNDGQILKLEKRKGDTIAFKDLYVEAICVKNWDINEDGYLSYAEAAEVESIGNVFSRFDLANSHFNNTFKVNPIATFDELKYFTELEEIPSRAFEDCLALWRISLPESLTYIGEYAFRGCSLSQVEVPKGVISLGANPFIGCKDIEFKGKFASVDGRTLIVDDKFVSFSHRSEDPVEYKIPEGVVYIGNSAFFECDNLGVISIPESVVTIEGNAFYNCSALKVLTIPKNVKTIESFAFYDCIELTTVYSMPTVPPKLSNSEFSKYNNATLIVPKGYKSAYENSSWKLYFSTIIEME